MQWHEKTSGVVMMVSSTYIRINTIKLFENIVNREGSLLVGVKPKEKRV